MAPDIFEALIKTIELKDATTAAHTWRVVLYTRALAEAFGVDAETLQRVTQAAALHDVGKIDVPDEILQKPGALTPAEFEVIKTHTVLGHERLVRMGEDDPILLEFVRHHHERVDGAGYPDGLSGEQIPAGPRYFAVIDSFDALTSVRPYRAAVGEGAARRALEELEASVGTRYCAGCVEVFTKLHRSGELDWIAEHFSDGAALEAFSGHTAADRVTTLLRRRRPA